MIRIAPANALSLPGERTKAVTEWPRSTACRTTSKPIPPVAPRTTNFIDPSFPHSANSSFRSALQAMNDSVGHQNRIAQIDHCVTRTPLGEVHSRTSTLTP